MKNKIKNLVKEVGVNEVESILKEIKSKVNIKEELKKEFIELLTGCNISFDDNYIGYRKDSEILFYYNKSVNYFCFNYKIWLNFIIKYNLKFEELRDLLVGVVEEVLNYKDVTPDIKYRTNSGKWKKC